MSDKLKPCNLEGAKNGRHAWVFQKNIVKATMSATTGRIYKQGVYKCLCGSKKYGTPRHENTPPVNLYELLK